MIIVANVWISLCSSQVPGLAAFDFLYESWSIRSRYAVLVGSSHFNSSNTTSLRRFHETTLTDPLTMRFLFSRAALFGFFSRIFENEFPSLQMLEFVEHFSLVVSLIFVLADTGMSLRYLRKTDAMLHVFSGTSFNAEIWLKTAPTFGTYEITV